MADSEYHRNYWQGYKKRTRQVSVTMTLAEYKLWQEAAKTQGRKSVGQQLKAEALAYRDQAHLPETVTQNYVTELIRILRGIGNNLNQIAKHSNTIQRMIAEGEVIKMLRDLEATADGFTKATRRLTDADKST